MKQVHPKIPLVISAILIASFFRVIPHWPNFTPMAAIALLGGAFLNSRIMAVFVTIISLFISDILTLNLINSQWISPRDFFDSPATWILYVSYALMVFIGFHFLKSQQSGKNISISALACSSMFFLTSNFSVWMINELPKNTVGLLQTYALGIPFLAYDIAGNLFYSFLFFGIFRFVCHTWPFLNRKSIA